MESPRPYGTARTTASIAQDAANPASVPGRLDRDRASDPAPIPKSATARINPNV